jgi:hypothetical protein
VGGGKDRKGCGWKESSSSSLKKVLAAAAGGQLGWAVASRRGVSHQTQTEQRFYDGRLGWRAPERRQSIQDQEQGLAWH